jgi:hypothetical protein
MSTSTDTLQALLAEGWTYDSAEAHVSGNCDRMLCTGTHSDDTGSILAGLIQDALTSRAVQGAKAVRAYYTGTAADQAAADAAEAHADAAAKAMWGLFYDVAGNL